MAHSNFPFITDNKTKRRFPIEFLDQFLTNKNKDNYQTVEISKENNNNKPSNTIIKERNRKCKTPNYCKQENQLNKKKYIDFSQFYTKTSPNNQRQKLYNLKARDNIQKLKQKQRELKELKEKQLRIPKKSYSSRQMVKNYIRLYSTKSTVRSSKDNNNMLLKSNDKIKRNKSKYSNQIAQLSSTKVANKNLLGRQKYFNIESLKEMNNQTSVKSNKDNNRNDKNIGLIDKVLLTMQTQFTNEKPKIEYVKNKYKPIFELYEK